VITHDMPSVFAVADRVGLVSERRIARVLGVSEAHHDAEVQAFVQGEEAA
jgi:ABC-type transporter Mla maintaining outer membrane lipid asymmetry ATPase subunit MlaF